MLNYAKQLGKLTRTSHSLEIQKLQEETKKKEETQKKVF